MNYVRRKFYANVSKSSQVFYRTNFIDEIGPWSTFNICVSYLQVIVKSQRQHTFLYKKKQNNEIC